MKSQLDLRMKKMQAAALRLDLRERHFFQAIMLLISENAKANVPLQFPFLSLRLHAN